MDGNFEVHPCGTAAELARLRADAPVFIEKSPRERRIAVLLYGNIDDTRNALRSETDATCGKFNTERKGRAHALYSRLRLPISSTNRL